MSRTRAVVLVTVLTLAGFLPMASASAATCAAPWSSSSEYTGGAVVSYGSHNWSAQWWTKGETPGTTGEWGVWRDQGSCGTATPGPTDGWRQASFAYNMQKPYDLSLSQRYRHDAATGTHTMWVYATDKPHTANSNTDPRTEMRWHQEYSGGQHMFDADVYIPTGVSVTTVMQILRVGGGAPGTPATDLMLNVFNLNGGSLHPSYSSRPSLKTGLYNTWFNLKVAHNASTGQIQIFIDNQLKLTTTDNGPATRHFKNGVYHHGDSRAEARFKNIRYWVR